MSRRYFKKKWRTKWKHHRNNWSATWKKPTYRENRFIYKVKNFFLSLLSLPLLLIPILLIAFVTPFGSQVYPYIIGYDQFELQIHNEINARRTEQGLYPLQFDKQLSAVARAHSKDMVERWYFSHYSPEGYSPQYRAGYLCNGVAENLAQENGWALGIFVPWQVSQGWMGSPGHRMNMLGPYRREGIGVYYNIFGTPYITQVLC